VAFASYTLGAGAILADNYVALLKQERLLSISSTAAHDVVPRPASLSAGIARPTNDWHVTT
jgi:hypothetical protein